MEKIARAALLLAAVAGVAAAQSYPNNTYPWPQNGYVGVGTGTATPAYPLEAVEAGYQPGVNVPASGSYGYRASIALGANAADTQGWVSCRDPTPTWRARSPRPRPVDRRRPA
jgi:hypothetical protein